MLDKLFNDAARRSGMDGKAFAALHGGQVTPEKTRMLAAIVDSLEGAYNPGGIRKWFSRARSQLGGQSPRDVLSRPWSPEDPGPRKILALARSLSGRISL